MTDTMQHHTHFTAEIIKHLTRITASGRNQSYIFEDWLQLVEASLDAIPAHLQSLAGAGIFATDTPETAELFHQIKTRYPNPAYMDHFAAAFALLMDSAAVDYMDVVGQVYMQFGYPNPHSGQFFTPWNIAWCMAEMTLHDALPELHSRLKRAVEQSPAATAALFAGIALKEEESFDWFITRVITPALPHFQPITVCDPCVGSGVMLLAAAKAYPPWAVQMGLVQFYGMDIDPTCVRMARINCKLYGLNGIGVKNALLATQVELNAIPQPYAEIYQQAQAQPAQIPTLTVDLRQLKQLSLF